MAYTMSLTRSPKPRTSLVQRARHAMRAFWRGPYSLKDPALSRLFGSGYESAAGIQVTNENAYTFSAVFDAVNQIASDVGKLPRNHHKRLKGGGSEVYEDSKLQYLLKNEPNPEMVAMVFWRTIIAHALTLKGGFAEIERDAVDRPIAFWLLTPDRVEPKRRERPDGTLGPLEYLVDSKDWISARNMLHIHGLGYDGINGYGIIALARQTIGLALAAEKFGAQFFGRGTMFGGVLETDQDLDEDQKKEIQEAIKSFREAQDSAFRILVTGLGHKFHQFTSKPSESQMDESRRSQVEEVARFFRMPPYRLGVNTPGTVSYASVEAAQIDYYTGPILDWVTLIEQELNRKCISPLERRQQFVKHNVSAFLRGTIKDRFEALGIARDKGIINADEWREFEDWNPQPNGQGKIYLVQSAQVPVDRLPALVDSQIDANKAKAKPPEPPPASPSQQDVDGANDRASRAEEAAREAKAQADALREQITVLEAVGQEQTAEVQTLRDALAAQQTIAGNMTVLATDLRAKAEELEAAKAESDTALSAAIAAREAAELQMRDAQEAVERAEAVRVQAANDAETARIDAEESKRLAAEASREAAAALARAEQAGADHEAETKARAEAEEFALLSKELAATAERQLQEAAELTSRAKADADAARTELERVTAEIATRDATVAQTAADAAAMRQQVETMQALIDSQQSSAQQEVDALKAALAKAEQDRDAERTARERAAAAESERMTATLTAHRGLIVDALGRMTRREAQQARSKQATPEKLRRWLTGFAELHEDICVEALLPAMRTHLAWKRSADDPTAATTALVKQHIALFAEQVRGVLDGDPEDFHVRLDKLLTRWEQDRAATVADALMLEELNHVRAQQ